MTLAMEWKTGKPGTACTCGRPINEGDEYTAALFPAGESFERRDFCQACWNSPPEAFSFWRTRAPKRGEKKKENTLGAWNFFESLVADPAPERRKLCFLLSLTLQRKRILKLAGTRREGAREFLQLEKKPEGIMFSVEVPEIRDDEMAVLREELVRLLGF